MLLDAEELIPSVLWALHLSKETTPIPLVDMLPISGEDKILWFGARHIMEGAGMAIQVVQSRLGKEESALSAKIGPGRTALDRVVFQRLLGPYFVTHHLYGGFTASPRVAAHTSLEGLYLLSDLALMDDKTIEEWDDIKRLTKENQASAISSRIRNDNEPGFSFIKYASLLANYDTAVRRITNFEWGKKEIAYCQNDLRKIAKHRSDVKTNSENIIDFIRFSFSLFKDGGVVPKLYLDIMEDVFLRSARFRSEVLNGGGHLEGVLSKRENLIRVLQMLPGVIVNNEILSVDIEPGVGIGVALNRLSLMQEISGAIIEGDQSCCRDDALRNCAAAVIPLCKSIASARVLGDIKGLHCAREEAIYIIREIAGVEKLTWS